MWEGTEAGRINVAHSGNWGKIPVIVVAEGDGQAMQPGPCGPGKVFAL